MADLEVMENDKKFYVDMFEEMIETGIKRLIFAAVLKILQSF